MAKTILGKVGMTPKGAYNNTTEYVRLDVVTKNGQSYVCLKNCSGKDVTNTTYWQLIASKGEMPVNGVDYNTEEDKQAFKEAVVEDSKIEMDNYTADKKEELDIHTIDKKTELNNYKKDLEDEMSTTKDTLTGEITATATDETNKFNTNAESKTNAFNDNVTEKTTNYNTNTETKIKEYNDNTTTKLNEYNTNATNKVEEFNNNADSIENELTELASQMPWNTTEIQDSIHVEDSAKYSRNKLGLFGNLVQEKRSGKNLIDFSNYVGKASTIEYSFTDDVVVATQKSAQSYAGVSFDILDTVKNNPSKKLKFVYESLDVSNYTLANDVIIQIETTRSSKTSYIQMLYKDERIYTYTIPNDTSDITSAILRIYTNNSATAIETSTVKITKPMLLFTDITDETYEKYGAMPSIEYPSMPVVATGVQKIRKIGKNTFDNDCWELGMIRDADGTILSHNAYIRTKLIPIKPNEDYVLNMYTERLYEYDINGNWIKTTQFGNPSTFAKKNLKIKTNVDTCYVRFRYHIGHADSIITTLADMKKQENLLATGTDVNIPYEPYLEETFNLDLGTTELCKIVDGDGNIVAQDRVVYKDGKWQFEKNVGKYILKNAVWNKSSKTEVNRYYCNNVVYTATVGRDKKDLVSNCFKTINIIQSDANDIGICRYNDRGFIINFDLYDTNFDTLEKFNEYIQNSDAMVYYPNKSVIYEDCTPAQSQVLDKLYKLSLQKGTNNIYVESENGVTTELQLTYMQDLMSQINELKQAMLNIGGN